MALISTYWNTVFVSGYMTIGLASKDFGLKSLTEMWQDIAMLEKSLMDLRSPRPRILLSYQLPASRYVYTPSI